VTYHPFMKIVSVECRVLEVTQPQSYSLPMFAIANSVSQVLVESDSFYIKEQSEYRARCEV